MNRLLRLFAVLLLLPGIAMAQEDGASPATFDTSYPQSTVLSARIQRQFLDSIRWSVSAEARDNLAAAFAERPALDIWQDLVATDGLKTGNVVDALTAYWVLNWVTANARYNFKVDNGPIRAQLQAAMAADPNFRALNSLQKQEMAEGYILRFLVEHAALNDAVKRKDITTLGTLALASVTRFRQEMGVDLLALEPGPDGFAPKGQPASAAGD